MLVLFYSKCLYLFFGFEELLNGVPPKTSFCKDNLIYFLCYVCDVHKDIYYIFVVCDVHKDIYYISVVCDVHKDIYYISVVCDVHKDIYYISVVNCQPGCTMHFLRTRREREKMSVCIRTTTDTSGQGVNPHSTQPNPTQPNPTQPNPTQWLGSPGQVQVGGGRRLTPVVRA